MNKTRRFWSAELGCCREGFHQIFFFILTASLIFTATVFFYFTLYMVNKSKENSAVFSNASTEEPTLSAQEAGPSNERPPRIVNQISRESASSTTSKVPVKISKVTNTEANRKRNNAYVANNLINLDDPAPASEAHE